MNRTLHPYLCRKSHTPRRQHSRVGDAGGHHAELAIGHELHEALNFFLERHILIVFLLVRVCRLVTGVCVAKGHVDGSREGDSGASRCNENWL